MGGLGLGPLLAGHVGDGEDGAGGAGLMLAAGPQKVYERVAPAALAQAILRAIEDWRGVRPGIDQTGDRGAGGASKGRGHPIGRLPAPCAWR